MHLGWPSQQGPAIGQGDVEASLIVEVEVPPLSMSLMVMVAAQWNQVGEVGQSAVVPGHQMVEMASLERCLTAVDTADRMECLECTSLQAIGQP